VRRSGDPRAPRTHIDFNFFNYFFCLTKGKNYFFVYTMLRFGWMCIASAIFMENQGGVIKTEGVFFNKCSDACNSCFADHLMGCYASCFQGCQGYCKKDTFVGMPGCTDKAMWSATPGTPPEFVPQYRICRSNDADGCPS